jgi:hypothetical protein
MITRSNRRLLRTTVALASIWLCACGDDDPSAKARRSAITDGEQCEGVSLEPFPAGEREDRGPEGLAALREEAQASLDLVDKLRKEHGDNYTYRVSRSSWTGFSCSTIITVRDGKVVKREQNQTYQEGAEGYVGEDGGAPKEDDWVEEGDQVGSHSDACDPVLTLPEVYAPCLAEVLCSDPTENLIYLTKDKQGLLLFCGAAPVSCADDCTRGVQVASVTFQ